MRSFAGLPLTDQPSGTGAVVLGADAVREASALLRPWHPTLGLDVLADAVDGGESAVAAWLEAGAVPVVVGGESLRAQAERHGPLGLLAFGAHARAQALTAAVEEALIDPGRTLVAGARGPLGAPDELDRVRDLGIDLLTGDELRALGPGEYSQRVLTRTAGASCLLAVDLDVVDPAFAPAVRSPEVAGLLPHEAITLLRSLAGTPFAGFELTGLDPGRDGPGQITSVLAANLVWEMLALRVLSPP